MRILGLDVGQKTIGVAVSDPLGFTAQGLTTIRRTNKEKDIQEIKNFCDQYDAKVILIGLPKNMNGTIGPSGEIIMAFGKLLEEELKLEVKFWDERLTTVAAHRAMLEADLSRNKRKKIVDKVASTFILQGYLDMISRK
ncbi:MULTISPECIES: Holliday junction resolvase RuvX [Clostridium]|uniref:Putative pre-16S rRNA nuclease n=1 Tax=Clostridium saccharoperbutylacetonicum N1-4(HMT) TaxID=931276 RepID=M1MF61_9CLOT|nr:MULTISPECIES: Holliday junction resolvase RuvX [Clostridium]AGF55018.1 putative holliday junction resolvase [Clostridium saccharoperbutylacetonicum N1-4(HMT)]AQR93907.1 putative holliday junction resolvase [Clostridium saccharoperbutylacetonicum]NRT64273.1 putative Holliday junction resolvase [Clostridium saccharoperbutylacetonicum]NSB27642.1 putative Holliday junction resolvase [Clostridium saccharoperbutylacetonicum]NSB29605.1 putative Holliday junction resolvase [Clostridium saccharoperb